LQKLAGKLGLQDVSQLFGETLQEEQQADETLAGVAENIPGGEVFT
jgi:ferritin-like metal-binding protein YciE